MPEGYKTHKTIGLSSYPFPSTAPPASSAAVRPAFSSENSRELTPFCGLHKVGGWATQPSLPPPSSPPAAFAVRDEQYDDMPALSISQNTVATSQNSFTASLSHPATKKRSRGDEDDYERVIEDDLDAFFNDFGSEEPVMATTNRVFAQPRSLGKKAPTAGQVAVVNNDFDEAPFLAPVEGMEVDDMSF